MFDWYGTFTEWWMDSGACLWTAATAFILSLFVVCIVAGFRKEKDVSIVVLQGITIGLTAGVFMLMLPTVLMAALVVGVLTLICFSMYRVSRKAPDIIDDVRQRAEHRRELKRKKQERPDMLGAVSFAHADEAGNLSLTSNPGQLSLTE
jgi:hypothetical protein